MKQILFVCTGNTCRSSMAEGIFNALIDSDEELKGMFKASSAGVYAYDGDSASANSIKALMEEWGIDISSHTSRMISENEVENAHLILTMTKAHKEAILSAFPALASKVFTLKEYAAGNEASQDMEYKSMEHNSRSNDITDPYGMPIEFYKSCAKEIRSLLEIIIKNIK